MTFAQVMRLIWIDAVLSDDRPLQRSEIAEAFGISIPQVSLDLREYQARWPDTIRYDRRHKGYFRKGRAPVFPDWHRNTIRLAQRDVRGVMAALERETANG